MLLTYKVRHNRDLRAELAKAKEVAKYAIEHRSCSTADVKHIGLKSTIACQILESTAETVKLERSGTWF